MPNRFPEEIQKYFDFEYQKQKAADFSPHEFSYFTVKELLNIDIRSIKSVDSKFRLLTLGTSPQLPTYNHIENLGELFKQVVDEYTKMKTEENHTFKYQISDDVLKRMNLQQVQEVA